MAKYIGLLTSDARGKVGGLVMTKARGGTTLKAHSGGINPATAYQTYNRQSFGSAIAAWKRLTDPQRTTWSLLATQFTYLNSLAQPYQPTGLQLWTQAFMCAQQSAGSPPASAPSLKPSIDQIVGLTAYTVGPVFSVSATDSVGAYPGSWLVSSSFIVPPTVGYTTGIRRRFMGYTYASATVNCSFEWGLAYGTLPAPLSWVALRAIPFDLASRITGTPVNLLVQVS